MIKPSDIKKKENEIRETIAWRKFIYVANELLGLQKTFFKIGLPHRYLAIVNEETGELCYQDSLIFRILVRNGYKCTLDYDSERDDNLAHIIIDYMDEEGVCQ